MLSRSASLAMSTSVLKALSGKPDIKRRSPRILYISDTQNGTNPPNTLYCANDLDTVCVYKGLWYEYLFNFIPFKYNVCTSAFFELFAC